MVPDYDQITEDETGQLEFWDADGYSLGKFDSVKDFNEWRDAQNAETESRAEGSGSEGASGEESEGDASSDHGESESSGSADFGGSAGGEFGSGDEQAGDSEGVTQDAPLSVEVENFPDDYATVESVDAVLEQVTAVNTGLECLLTFQAVIVIAIFACWASIGVQTLIRSFER